MSQARIALLALTAASVASCASAPELPETLIFRTSFDATCRGGVGVASFRAPESAESVPPAPGAPIFDADVRLTRVSWEEAEALFGPGFTGTAARATSLDASRPELASFFERRPADKNSMRLTFFEGQRATISVVDQRSYVAAYTFESHDGASWIADPVVSTLEAGLWVALSACRAESDWEVEVELAWADIQEPPLRREVRLLDSPEAPALLEQPLLHHAVLETKAVLAAGEALVLAEPVTGPRAGVLVAVVEPRLVRAVAAAAPVQTASAP